MFNRKILNMYKANLDWRPSALPKQGEKPYSILKIIDSAVYLSGQIAFSEGKVMYKGKIGRDLTREEAKASAAMAVISCLDLFDQSYGLENIEQLIKLTGYLKCEEEFTGHPEILNAGSQVLIDVFGESGKHARSALGIHSLPLGASVEVEIIAKLKSDFIEKMMDSF